MPRRTLLVAVLIYIGFGGSSSISHAIGPPLEFLGTSSPFPTSSGLLSLTVPVSTTPVFRWVSNDPVLGVIDTGAIGATKWNYIPATSLEYARLVFEGVADDVFIAGNVLFEPFDRAIVDVVRGAVRVRYQVRVLKCAENPHAQGDFSVDANGRDVTVSGAPWTRTKYYYPTNVTNAIVSGTSSMTVSVDRFIPGTVASPGVISNGVVSATARIRLCVSYVQGTQAINVSLNGATTDSSGVPMILQPALGRTALQQFVVNAGNVIFPTARGLAGIAQGRPIGAANTVAFTNSTPSSALRYVIHWAELSFDAMSPYILVHGKGANRHFWRGFPAAPGTRNPGRAQACFPGFATRLEGRGIPFDDSISLGVDITGRQNSQGSIAGQALELDSFVRDIVTSFGTRHFNIIAHSKGGLDSRLWLTELKNSSAPTAVLGQFITLNTPHRGSVIADYAVAAADMDNATELAEAIARATAIHPHISLLLSGPVLGAMFGMQVDTAATLNLRTAFAAAFNTMNMPRLTAYRNPDGTRPTFLATRSDADRNRNGAVEIATELVIPACYDPTALAGDSAYQALRRVTSAALLGERGLRVLVQVRPPSGFEHRNDLLVTFESAFPEAILGQPFQLAGTFLKDHALIADGGTAAFLHNSGAIPRLK
jgi:hypothetical protein